MRSIILIILASWTFFRAHLQAQTPSAGYIVTMQNDTVRGFIMDGTDTELGLRVEFRKNPESVAIEYTPSDLRGFAFEYGREFSVFPTANDRGTPVFAKKNLEGKISLYTHDKPEANHPDIFLVNHSTRDTVQLTEPEKKVIETEGGSKRISESMQFIGLLAVIKNEPGIASHQRFKYNERSIRKDILRYNERYLKEFPVSPYKPKKTYGHEITVGLPIFYSRYSGYSDGTALRASFFRTKYLPENSRNWSFIRGVSYRYWSHDANFAGTPPRNRIEKSSQQVISLVPIGIKYEGAGKFIRPYIYLGVALAAIINIRDVVVENIEQQNETDIWLTPSINLGAGVKIKTGSKFVLMEISPSGGLGPHASVGFCF